MCVIIYARVYTCMCTCVWMCTRVRICVKIAEEMEFLFFFLSTLLHFFPAFLLVSLCLRACLCPLFRPLPSPPTVSDPHSVSLHSWVPLCVFPQRPLAQHPVSLLAQSTGYLGNHCRVSTCDWPDWGSTLGWRADFGGDSCPQSPLGEGPLSRTRKEPQCAAMSGASQLGKGFLS